MPERGIINGVEAETKQQPSAEAAGTAVTKRRTPPGGAAESKKFHPLWELTLARVREFLREPEVIFWVFVFPLLLVFALGIAFRIQGPQKIRVAVERSETNPSASSSLADALSHSGDLIVTQVSPS